MEILRQYKPFLFFLTKFFGVYLIGTLLYQAYLNTFDPSIFEIDSFTWLVAKQTKYITQLFGYNTTIMAHLHQPSVKLILDNRYVARVVEGCNALSVMILFASFVIAFKGKLKTTAIFLVVGALLIHVLNVFRIALLSIALLHYPQYEEMLHGIIFPSVIYGVVMVLWIIWVNKYSINAKTK